MTFAEHITNNVFLHRLNEQHIRNEGAAAMQAADYDTATSVIEFAKRLLAFQKIRKLGSAEPATAA